MKAEQEFLTSSAAVLVEIAGRPRDTMREIAAATGLTERQTVRITGQLVAAGFVTIVEPSSGNRPALRQVNFDKSIGGNGLFKDVTVGDLIEMFHDAAIRGLSKGILDARSARGTRSIERS